MKSSFVVCLVLISFIVVLQGCKTKAEKDASKALISAEQGAAIAQFRLGKMYASGEGVVEDKVYAYMWGSFAVDQGLGDTASEFISGLKQQMSPTQIAAAEKLAGECKTKGYKDC